MQTVYTDRHKLRAARTELDGGLFVAPYESPERAEIILDTVKSRNLGAVVDPDSHGLDPILAVHDPDYVDFLRDCWRDWVAAGHKGEAIATSWPSRRMTRAVAPRPIDGRIGYYCLAADTTISKGTWEAARAAVDVALTGQALVASGERAVFALTRPPGHHAAQDMFGGYCFLNNAAVAAQAFRDDGARRVAVLDIDFHHGNGTQSIFYDRADVMFLSIHGDPDDAFPYFLGAADERGAGNGEGLNVNYPLPEGCLFDEWALALDDACGRISAFAPEALVVSLGVDTFKEDPISFFRLESADFLRIGERLAAQDLPTLFVMEGGYAVQQIGVNTVNVLEGFENA